MADFFIYASKNLLGKPAITANADIALGEGWDLIDVNKMLTEKLFYSLTRYQSNLSCSSRVHMCLTNYQGSHDTHIFVLKEPLDEQKLQRLDYPTNMNQAENGMIYTMGYVFKFKVSNPCLTVKTYHHHCSPVRAHRQDNYTILNLGWTKEEVHSGISYPQLL
ncbi:uncharacterized protein [Watersipora subatra]|uniref:uncharacterized protein n=1 Tax=Watersipora subatra TaxID=2589382 RepID=UPI00355BC0DC